MQNILEDYIVQLFSIEYWKKFQILGSLINVFIFQIYVKDWLANNSL